jgi:hypothetical protein
MQKLIPSEIISTILSAGYNFDFIDAEAINSAGLGTHQILVIPPTDRIPLNTLKKIFDWSVYGGKVIAVGHPPTLDPEGIPSAEITELAKAIMLVPNASELTKALAKEGDPDLNLTTDDHTKEAVGFIRRKLPTADIYFVTNTSNQPVQATANFDTAHRDGEQWDPETGQAAHVTASNLPLNLAPYESRVFVFAHYSESEPPHRSPSNSASMRPLADLSPDWQLTYVSTKEIETEPNLTDWTSDPATAHYSGEAVYTRDLNLATQTTSPIYLQVDGGTPLPGAPNSPPEHPALGPNDLPDPRITRTGPGVHAYYDPPIHEAAIVFLNGQRVGSLWHPPYRLDVSKFLKPGQNHFEIHVYNTALNACSALPPHDYKPLIEKYGDRFQMQDLNKVEPIPSGLLGTIHLVTEAAQ